MRVTEAESYELTIFPDEKIDNLNGEPFFLSDIWWDLIRNPNTDWGEGILDIKWFDDSIEIHPANDTYITGSMGINVPWIEMDFEGRGYDWEEGG